jgi:hypothetical protein
MARIPKNSVALAGEFAALSQLAVRGYEAALTLGHTKNVDILVYDPVTGNSRQIEVKTNFERRNRHSESRLFGKFITDWQMHRKHETISMPDLFYCFVHINSPRTEPSKYSFRYFVVPSKIVAAYVHDEHALWLRDDPAHKTGDRRLFRIGLENDREIEVPAPLGSLYENNWGQIASPATTVLPEQ